MYSLTIRLYFLRYVVAVIRSHDKAIVTCHSSVQPLRVGDVLRCHRVRAQQWQGLLQLVGHPEKGTAFVVFSPVIDLLTGNFIPNPNPTEVADDNAEVSEESASSDLPKELEAEFNK